MLTTAGAARLTSGAKDRVICSRASGATLPSAACEGATAPASGNARANSRARRVRTVMVLGTGGGSLAGHVGIGRPLRKAPAPHGHLVLFRGAAAVEAGFPVGLTQGNTADRTLDTLVNRRLVAADLVLAVAAGAAAFETGQLVLPLGRRRQAAGQQRGRRGDGQNRPGEG